MLRRLLAAIQTQAFTDFEVIVVDDGSDAATRAAFPALWEGLDHRFRLIELGGTSGVGVGPSVARNLAIDSARGDILTFCDDDDFWTSAAHLQAMAGVFEQEADVDLYIANQVAVSTAGVVERDSWLPGLDERVKTRARSHARGYRVTLDDLARAGGFAQLNIVALRKSVATAIGGFWTRTTYEEDRDFYWRAVDAARAVFFSPDIVAQHNVPDPLRQNNLSRSFSQAERWLLSVLVSQHVALTVRHDVIRTMCQQYEGDILRRLSHHCSSEARHALALQYACRALAARASYKWALYTAALAARQLFRSRA